MRFPKGKVKTITIDNLPSDDRLIVKKILYVGEMLKVIENKKNMKL